MGCEERTMQIDLKRISGWSQFAIHCCCLLYAAQMLCLCSVFFTNVSIIVSFVILVYTFCIFLCSVLIISEHLYGGFNNIKTCKLSLSWEFIRVRYIWLCFLHGWVVRVPIFVVCLNVSTSIIYNKKYGMHVRACIWALLASLC